MRITHVISGIDSSIGGPVSALIGLAAAQAAVKSLHVTVVPALTSTNFPPTVDILQRAGISVSPIYCRETPLALQGEARRQLEPIVAESDVLHIYGLWEGLQHTVVSLCRRMSRPYIFEPCGMLDEWSLRRGRLKKKIFLLLRLRKDLDHAAAIHVSTIWERDQTAKIGLKPPLVVVPAGVDLAEFKGLPERGLFRRRFPRLQGKRVIMFLGRIYPGKGLEMLIPALAKMENSNAILVVVGHDSVGYQAQMHALAAKLGVEERVIFAGMARGQERIEALVDADVFSLPSEHENFGVAVLEAMAAGIPVVVSDQVGLCHDITTAGAGEAVPLEPDALANALDRWLLDDQRRATAGERGRALAFERFTWGTIAERWCETYRQLGIAR